MDAPDSSAPRKLSAEVTVGTITFPVQPDGSCNLPEWITSERSATRGTIWLLDLFLSNHVLEPILVHHIVFGSYWLRQCSSLDYDPKATLRPTSGLILQMKLEAHSSTNRVHRCSGTFLISCSFSPNLNCTLLATEIFPSGKCGRIKLVDINTKN